MSVLVEAPRLLSAEQVADRLSINVHTVYRLARQGELVTTRIGARRLFDPADVIAFVERSKANAGEDATDA